MILFMLLQLYFITVMFRLTQWQTSGRLCGSRWMYTNCKNRLHVEWEEVHSNRTRPERFWPQKKEHDDIIKLKLCVWISCTDEFPWKRSENMYYQQRPNNHQIRYMRQSRDTLEVQEPSETFRRVRYRQLHRRPSTATGQQRSGRASPEQNLSAHWSEDSRSMVHVWTEVWFSSDHGIIQVSCTGVMLKLLYLVVCLCVCYLVQSALCMVVCLCVCHRVHLSESLSSWEVQQQCLMMKRENGSDEVFCCQAVTLFHSLCSRLPLICINKPVWPSRTTSCVLNVSCCCGGAQTLHSFFFIIIISDSLWNLPRILNIYLVHFIQKAFKCLRNSSDSFWARTLRTSVFNRG